jgi:hypothetical protein
VIIHAHQDQIIDVHRTFLPFELEQDVRPSPRPLPTRPGRARILYPRRPSQNPLRRSRGPAGARSPAGRYRPGRVRGSDGAPISGRQIAFAVGPCSGTGLRLFARRGENLSDATTDPLLITLASQSGSWSARARRAGAGGQSETATLLVAVEASDASTPSRALALRDGAQP